MDTPTFEKRLQRMSYSDLRKYARKSGIKGNKTAKDFIASILESADDSFVAREQDILNSCNKNKIEKFEEDKATPSDTPRRDTYTIDNPLDVSLALNNDLISSSASPTLKKTPVEHDNSLNVTLTRGSEKKTKKRKVSFVTPIRRSARLSTLTPHFNSVKDRPKTPIPSRVSSGRKRETSTKEAKMFCGSLFITNSARKSSEGGRRPSTPMPNPKPKRMKLSSSGLLETPAVTPVSTPKSDENVSDVSLSKQKQLNKLSPISTPKSDGNISDVSLSKQKQEKLTLMPAFKTALTPATLSITKVKRSSPRNSAVKRGVPLTNPKTKAIFTPKSDNRQTPASMSITKVKKIGTPLSGIKNGTLPSGKTRNVTPKSQLKRTPLQSSSAKAKRTTPNFNKLHQKQFDKMESIDEYIKRKQINSTKKINEQQKLQESSKASSSKKVAFKKNSSIPKKFNGIPFIPTITSTMDVKTNFGFATSKPNLTPGKRLPAVKFGLHNESVLSKKLVGGGVKVTKPVTKENTPIQKKFDLKASLSRKLSYKPHTGPLKPLGQTNTNASIFTGAFPPPKTATENRVIKAKRIETRGALRGVRKNRRFELQMNNRKDLKA